MNTVGQLLKAARLKHKFSLEEISTHTRIRKTYLKALENDEYDALPSATYAKGFIKNYAQFLKLPEETLLAVFRRDFVEDDGGKIIPRSMLKPVATSHWAWTPKITMATSVGFLLALFLGFLSYQYTSLLRPRLELYVPEEGEVLVGPLVQVSGKTDPSAVLSINGNLVVVGDDGYFESRLPVVAGEATIYVEAVNNRQRSTSIQRRVTIKEPAS